MLAKTSAGTQYVEWSKSQSKQVKGTVSTTVLTTLWSATEDHGKEEGFEGREAASAEGLL